jgi:glycosyltransferase involved in cell wall biosynthesis
MVFSMPFPPQDGIGYYIYNLSKSLRENGHEVIILTRGSWKKTQREFFDGIEVIKTRFIPIYPFYLMVHGKYTNEVFKKLEPEIDLVHIHSPLPPVINTKRPKVITIHTPKLMDSRYINLKSFYSIISKIFGRFISYPHELKLIHNSDCVMTISQSIAQELKEEYSIDLNKIFIVGNGVDEKFFQPLEEKHENKNKYILYVGQILRDKGIFDLLECARNLCKERFDVSFILAGVGRDSFTLERKIKEVKLQNRFILLGQVDKEKLLKLYQNASLFVFPSYHEGLPSALMEAMSCSLPIVATDVRGNRDLICNNENGILVPSGDPKKMAGIINLLLNDQKLSNKLGKNARKTIEKNYTWDKVSCKIIKCYESVMNRQM